MTTTTSDLEQAVGAFDEQGFTSIPQLLTADEVARYRTAVLQVIEQGQQDETTGTGLIATTDAWETSDMLRELALHPRLGAIAERLAGMPLRVWGGEVLAKQPGETAVTGLHDDLTFELLQTRITFNAWIALVDVPVERGCLTFLPGSHRRPPPERIGVSHARATFDSYILDHWPDLAWSRRVTVPLRAGDATFHQSRTAHLAGGNTTDQVRLAFVVTFTDAEAAYRPLPGHDPLPMEAGQPIAGDRYPRAGAGTTA